MNEPWLLEELGKIPGYKNSIPYDPASLEKSFCFGTDGSSSVVWGNIGGDIINQLDLYNALMNRVQFSNQSTSKDSKFGTDQFGIFIEVNV